MTFKPKEMTVGELKKLLNQFDDDMPLFVDGSNGGYNSLSPNLKVEQFSLDENKDNPYVGNHCLYDDCIETGNEIVVDGIRLTGYDI
jgi:hypothetical protein